MTFDPSSDGQVALVMYEWKDVQYLGVETPETVSQEDRPVRSLSELVGLITDLTEDVHLYHFSRSASRCLLRADS